MARLATNLTMAFAIWACAIATASFIIVVAITNGSDYTTLLLADLITLSAWSYVVTLGLASVAIAAWLFTRRENVPRNRRAAVFGLGLLIAGHGLAVGMVCLAIALMLTRSQESLALLTHALRALTLGPFITSTLSCGVIAGRVYSTRNDDREEWRATVLGYGLLVTAMAVSTGAVSAIVVAVW